MFVLNQKLLERRQTHFIPNSIMLGILLKDIETDSTSGLLQAGRASAMWESGRVRTDCFGLERPTLIEFVQL